MKEIILVKFGEMALKGQNKYSFEDALFRQIKYRLKNTGNFRYSSAQSTIYIEPLEESIDLDEVIAILSKVFGIASICRACVCEKDFADIQAKTLEYLREQLEDADSFKIEAKRADKKFSMKSPEICRELGSAVCETFPELTVDVHNPEMTIIVEIRDTGAYVHAGRIKGAGGLPLGTSGKAMLL
ncbi:MAG: tRNA 4-thiouridine(8) synthase ThiI, partial [Oscillospiraceae bacterium]|nr:tRNA 4-thiouridine(8) synthase ThiI [Oscillospiraceae bacterium]